MSEPAILLNRSFDDSIVSSNLQGTPFVDGAIGFVTYATGSNPTAEAMSSTVDATAGHVVNISSHDTTISLSAGTITLARSGLYRLALTLTNVTAASNSGVFLFAIQKNAAALTNPCTIGWTNAAAILPGAAGSNSQVVSCVAGDVIRAVFTGSTGGIVTVGNGNLTVQMVADAAPMGFTRV